MNRHVFIFPLLLCGGCATMFSGTQQRFSIDTRPSGAKVFMDSQYEGTTPLTMQLNRRWDHHTLRLTMEGHRDIETTVPRSFNETSIFNIFLPVGFLVDAATGAVFKYSDAVRFDFEADHNSPLACAEPKTTDRSSRVGVP